MADTSAFEDIGGQLVSRMFSGIIWFGIAFIIIVALGITMWYFLVYKKKFDISVKIISKRAKDRNSVLFDNAAILYDRKTHSKFFRLWKTKVDLPVPNFNILQKTDKGDYIEIYRLGEDRFYYLLPPKIDKRYVIKSDGKIVPVMEQSMNAIDPDLSYWATKRKMMNRGMFDPEKLWVKILPYIPLLLGGVFMIFILYLLMSYLPDILSQLKELVNALDESKRAQIVTEAIV